MKTIRLIHNLPRSGGTIISKCLAAQKDTILLSEIHPNGIEIRKKMGLDPIDFDPIFQFQIWNNSFEKDEYKKISNSDYKFEEKIDLIYEKTESLNKKLVIRDWAFADYFGKPFTDPKYKNSLLEILNKKYEILNLYIMRDPLKLYISCLNKLSFFDKHYNFDFFLKGYRNFFLNINKTNICIFENFIKEPEKNLQRMCNILKIQYDHNYLIKLKDVNITGDDNARKSLKIHNNDTISKKKFNEEEILNKIKNHPDFIKLKQDYRDFY